MSKEMSLKAKIRNIAKQKNIPAQVILQNYMFEHLLMRLSLSKYKEMFVIKGGILVAAIVGLDNRATMDLDTTLKNLPLTQPTIQKAMEDICNIFLDDDISFEIKKIYSIRKNDNYGGFCVILNAKLSTIITQLSIDISTGDIITPRAILYKFHEMFDENSSYELWVYNIETILAEKIETILHRGIFNTRPRDFYDIYALTKTQVFDKDIFLDALKSTSSHRGTYNQISNIQSILENLEESNELKMMWEKYRKQFSYASKIEFQQIIEVLKQLLNK